MRYRIHDTYVGYMIQVLKLITGYMYREQYKSRIQYKRRIQVQEFDTGTGVLNNQRPRIQVQE